MSRVISYWKSCKKLFLKNISPSVFQLLPMEAFACRPSPPMGLQSRSNPKRRTSNSPLAGNTGAPRLAARGPKRRRPAPPVEPEPLVALSPRCADPSLSRGFDTQDKAPVLKTRHSARLSTMNCECVQFSLGEAPGVGLFEVGPVYFVLINRNNNRIVIIIMIFYRRTLGSPWATINPWLPGLWSHGQIAPRHLARTSLF